MVEPIFAKEHILSMRPQIQKTVDSLLDTIIKEGSSQPVDLGEKLAIPVPSYVRHLTEYEDMLTRCRPSTAFSVFHFRTSNDWRLLLQSVVMVLLLRQKPRMPTQLCYRTWVISSSSASWSLKKISLVFSSRNNSFLDIWRRTMLSR